MTFLFFGFINRTQASEHCEMISLRWHNSSDTCGIFPFYKGESLQKKKRENEMSLLDCASLSNHFFTQLQIIFNIFQSFCLSLLVSKMFRTMRRGQQVNTPPPPDPSRPPVATVRFEGSSVLWQSAFTFNIDPRSTSIRGQTSHAGHWTEEKPRVNSVQHVGQSTDVNASDFTREKSKKCHFSI